jgi:hypothetical protein
MPLFDVGSGYFSRIAVTPGILCSFPRFASKRSINPHRKAGAQLPTWFDCPAGVAGSRAASNCCFARTIIVRSLAIVGDAVKPLDVSQAAAAIRSGGVLSAILQGRGGSFYIEFETRTGPAELVTTNAPQKPRAFKNPLKALALVRELGLETGRFNIEGWRPQDAELERQTRPDRSVALKEAHQAAAYNAWLSKKVSGSQQGLADGSNERIDPQEWEKLRAEKRAARPA